MLDNHRPSPGSPIGPRGFGPWRIPAEILPAPGYHSVQSATPQCDRGPFPAFAQAFEYFDGRARIHPVFLDEFQLVDAQLGGQLGQGCLEGEGTLGCAIALVGTGGGKIGIPGTDLEARVPADQERQALGYGVHRHGEAMLPIGACVGVQIHFYGGEPPVPLGSEGHPDIHRMSGSACREFLFPAEPVVNGLSGCPCQIARQILDDKVLLGAEAASDPFFYHPDFVLRNAHHPGDDAPDVPGHLGGGMEHQPPRIDPGQDDVGLQGGALNPVGPIASFQDQIGLGQALRDVADSS